MISFEEKKQIQLDMLKEIDIHCSKNNIRYSLSCGTLIGAIRHQGYIPWDDDVDIEMPKGDLIRFKNTFSSQYLQFIDCDINPHYPHYFPRVVDTRSYQKIGKLHRTYGINIDIYPNIELPDDKDSIDYYLTKGKKLKDESITLIQKRRKYMRFWPFNTIPFYDSQKCDKKIKELTDWVYKVNGYGKHFYYSGSGGFGWNNVLDFNPFEELIEVDFEGLKFKSVKNFDGYLRTKYGDYMQLPPEKQRIPYHLGDFYWK